MALRHTHIHILLDILLDIILLLNSLPESGEEGCRVLNSFSVSLLVQHAVTDASPLLAQPGSRGINVYVTRCVLTLQ